MFLAFSFMLSLWSKLHSLCLGLLQQPPNQSPSLCSCLHRLSSEPTEMLLKYKPHYTIISVQNPPPSHWGRKIQRSCCGFKSFLDLAHAWLWFISFPSHFGYSFYSASNTEAHSYLEAFAVAVHSVWNAFPPELLQNLLPLFIQVSA